MPIDQEKLQNMTVPQRWQLYQNARRLLFTHGARATEATQTIELIETSGLPYYDGGGLSVDDPVYQRMVEIVYSAEGRRAAVDAVDAGLPALCGVDRLLRDELGTGYGKHDLGTASAGDLVAKLMRELGYEEAGKGPCPADCVARIGLKWRPKASYQR